MFNTEVDPPSSAISQVELSATDTPGYIHAADLKENSAKRASELLTANHALYHTRFNAGFHNHIVHHLLSLWALGASPDEIQDMWEFNKSYQDPIERVSVDVDLKDPALFDQCLGNDDRYADFLRFFEGEVATKGVPDVIREYLLKGDERANDIFCRMYTDLVHPIIHLGCALEFNQPSLVAEALAAACVHANWPKTFLLPTEEYVRSVANVPSKPLLQILDDLRNDHEIASGVKSTDPFNKIPDGLLKRVGAKQLVPFLSQFQVKPEPEDLQRKMAEMMHTCAYMSGAAQQPGKREHIDFVLLHSVTLFAFYPAILAQDWLTDQDKSRLLEAKARMDAVLYAGCGSPALYPERIISYKPRHPGDGWPELIHRSIVYRDEGHAAKLIRSLFSLEQINDTGSTMPIAKQDFIKIAHMSMDSIERAFEPDGHKMPDKIAEGVMKDVGKGGDMVVSNMMRWVFYGGLEGAWNFKADLETPAVSNPKDTHVAELRGLLARINEAVEDYAQDKTDSSNNVVKQTQILQHRAESPEVFAERLRYQPLDLCALMIAVEGGMLQALSDHCNEDITAGQLAEITNRPKLHIVRVLRLLTAIGVCDEVGAQRYRANDKTPVVASKGQIGGLRVSSVPVCAITTNVEEYFSQQAKDTLTENATQAPYVYTYGKPMYEVLRENKDKKDDFDSYMEARKKEKKRLWHHTYPVMSELSATTTQPDISSMTIVDVGGNRGHDLESFAENNPEFHGSLILQDLPETVKPLNGEKRVFAAMPHDFFTPQPIKGAKLYLLLACLHNWDDESSRSILKNLADAMEKGYSRLLISGVFVPEVGAERRQAELDMQMWMLQDTRQRTENEWHSLVNSAGLEIVKVWDNGDRESIIETKLSEK